MDINAASVNNENVSLLKKQLKEMQNAANGLAESAADAASAAKKQTLNGLIKRVEMMQSNMYSSKSWNKLMKVYAKAKSVEISETTDMRALRRATSELMSALSALEQAEKDDNDMREMLPVVLDLSKEKTPAQAFAADAAAAAAPAVTGGIDICL
jgi:hypothetical protein